MRTGIALILLTLSLVACAGEGDAGESTYLGGSTELWAERLASKDFRVQEDAMTRLASLRPDVVPVLAELIAHPDDTVRAGAIRSFLSIAKDLEAEDASRREAFRPLFEVAAEQKEEVVREAGRRGLGE